MAVRNFVNFPATADSDIVSIPHDSAFAGFDVGFTIEFGVRFDGVTSRAHLFEKATNISGNFAGWAVYVQNGDLFLLWSKDGSALSTKNMDVSGLTLGDYYHIAIVWETNTTPKFYLDGVEQSTGGLGASLEIYPATADLAIGAGQYTGNRRFDGAIFDVRIWNVARTGSEIANNYQESLTGSETGLVGYWKLDEGSGTTVADSSSTGSDGSLGGSTSWSSADVDWWTETAATEVDVPAASISLTAYAPTVTTSEDQTVDVPSASLSLTAYAPTVEAHTITFDADFERANLDVTSTTVTDGDTSTPSITVVPRTQNITPNTKFWFWMFKMSGVNGKTPTFTISATDYYLGSGYWPTPVFSYDRENWVAFDNATNTTTCVFSHNTAFTQDEVYVAYHYPYGITELEAWLDTLVGNPYISETTASAAATSLDTFAFAQTIQQTTDDSRTVPPLNLYSFRISDDSTSPDDGMGKRTCVLFAGVHAGEDVGNFQLEGAVDFILSSPDLLKNWEFIVYPMVNPAGRWGGNYRGCWEPGVETADPNRHMGDGTLDVLDKVEAALNTDVTEIHAFADLHGWKGSSVSGYGYYGNGDVGQELSDWLTAIEVYTGTLQYHGDGPTASNAAWITSEFGTAYSFSPETHANAMETAADLSGYGEAVVHALDDLYDAGAFAMGWNVDVPQASITLTGYAPSVSASADQTVEVPAGSITLTAKAPSVEVTDHQSVEVPAASLSLTANAPTVVSDGSIVVQIPSGTVTLSAFAPTLDIPAAISVPAASLSLAANAPDVVSGTSVSVPLASLTLTTFVPGVALTGNVSVPVGTITLTGNNPVVSITGIESTTPPERTLSVRAESRTLIA